MDENKLIPQELASAIATSSSTSILVNKGDGIQIQSNQAPITVNVSMQENAQLLASMFGVAPANNLVTHAVEWAFLSKTHYCLFVLENEEYQNGTFCISKDLALQKYTPKDVRKKYKSLCPENVEELKQMPCIFAKRNIYYKRTDENHPFLVGRITNIISQKENIKIYFSGFQAFSQELLNRNTKDLHIASASMRNELDEEHWAIKKCNLIDAFAKMHIDIK